MAAVSEEGRLEQHTTRPYAEVSKGYSYFERGDLLIAKITPCFENGKATLTEHLSEQTGFGSTEFHVLRPGPKLDAKYLFYLLWNERFRQSAAKGMTGSAGQKRVPVDLLRRTEIRLPLLEEQRRIAAILERADALRQKRKRAIALLDSLTQSIFLEMFGDPLHNPKIIRARPVRDVCTLLNGAAFKPSDWKEDGHPIIRIQNLNDSSKPFNRTTRTLNPRLWIRPGDYLFSWSGTPGTSFGCFKWQGPEGWLNQHIFKVGLVDDVLGSLFLHQMNIRMHELIAKAHGGVGLQHVTKGMIEEVEFLCPSIDDQRRFADAVEKVDTVNAMHHASLAQIEALFASLQHRAFSGQL